MRFPAVDMAPKVDQLRSVSMVLSFFLGNIILLNGSPADGVNKSGHYALEVFEAAFQGECREDAPCQQLCFDLYDGTFECGCKEGYTLFADGYTCIENAEYDKVWKLNLSLTSKASSGSQDSSNRHVYHYIVNSAPKEVKLQDTNDYSPNRKTPDPRSRTLSQSDSSSFVGHASETSEEQHSQAQSDYDSDSTEKDLYRPEIEFPRDEHLLQKVPERRHHRRTSTAQPWKQVVVPETEKSEELSSTFSMNDVASPSDFEPVNTVTMTTVPSTRHGRGSPSSPCDGTQCKNGGRCLATSDGDNVRCRCPLGWSGETCEKEEDIHFPRLKSRSYLTLMMHMGTSMPPPQMQIELEFRPELYEGIILYIARRGHSSKKEAFCSLALRNGILELRYFGSVRVGILRSDQAVTLNTWNRATVYFDEERTWLQLNDGLRPEKQTMGIYPVLFGTNTTLHLGGYPHISRKAYASESPSGIQGCIRHLSINSYEYSFRSSSSADILEGADLEECRPGVCNTVSCKNGGQCVAANPNWGTCLCPLGFGGDQCSETVEITVPSFDGTAHLQFPGLASSSLTYTEILFVLMPKAPDGALLYNGYRINGTGDFLSLSLESGYVILRFDLGTGVNTIRSLSPITLYRWHTVFVTRTGRLGVLQVDDEPPQKIVSRGGYSQLSLPLNLYIGGVPSPKELASGAEVNNSFVGCVQKLVINGKPVKLVEQALSGVNINNCEHPCANKPCANKGTCLPNMDSYTCLCATGYTGPNCKTEIVDMVSRPMFTGNSYLHYVSESLLNRLRGQSLQMLLSFRALSPYGLILWAGSKEVNTASDYLGLRLYDGHLRMDYNLGSGPISLFFNHSRVDDGDWHEVKVVRFKQRGSLTVDGTRTVTAVSPGPLKELNIPNELYLGGMPESGHGNSSVFQTGFVGCLSNFTLDGDYHVQFLTMAVTGINIQPCV